LPTVVLTLVVNSSFSKNISSYDKIVSDFIDGDRVA